VNAFDYGLVIDHLTGNPCGWRCTERYTSGPKVGVEIYYEQYSVENDLYLHCMVMIDGKVCKSCSNLNMCNDSYGGLVIDCSNIEPNAVYNDCEPDVFDGGELLRAFRWDFQSQECKTCLIDISNI
jgi:hypothetical protein